MLLHTERIYQSKLQNASAFCIPPIAVHEVAKFMTTVQSKKSTGTDNITPYLLKIALPYIVESLTYVYNLCIEQNIFPTALKNAKVVPLPQNDLSDPSNYRPISLLPVNLSLLRGTPTSTYSNIWKTINSSTSINLNSVWIIPVILP